MDPAQSYQRQSHHEQQSAARETLPSAYQAPHTVDAWRHRRMLASLLPLLQQDPGATWLTLGDGNYGTDAYFLKQNGADAVASSLTLDSLETARALGYLEKIARVNAEEIPFDDGSFDYILCKEAFHHFPRPAIAFYEMFRVARKAVVLIEPLDAPPRLLDLCKAPAKKLLWGKGQTTLYEPSGNFIYRLNVRETWKMLCAVGAPMLATRTVNDLFLPGRGGDAQRGSVGAFATRSGIALMNTLCALRLLNPALVCLLAFKRPPDTPVQQALRASRYQTRLLPRNPYA